MRDIGMILVEIINFSLEKPGIEFPRFCSIFAGNISNEISFVCYVGIVNDLMSVIKHEHHTIKETAILQAIS